MPEQVVLEGPRVLVLVHVEAHRVVWRLPGRVEGIQLPRGGILRRNRGILRAWAAGTRAVLGATAMLRRGAAALLRRGAAAIKKTRLIVELHDGAQLRKGTDG